MDMSSRLLTVDRNYSCCPMYRVIMLRTSSLVRVWDAQDVTVASRLRRLYSLIVSVHVSQA